MKILHIAPIGHQSEGIGTVLKHLVKEQTKLGHDVKIVTKYTNVVYDNIQMTTIKETKGFKAFIANWVPEVVLFHSLYEMEFVRFAKILNNMHIPYAVQMHGALSKENYKKSHFKKVVANRLWFYSYLKKARTLIFLNKAEYENCVIRGLNPNFEILPNGCDEIVDVEVRSEIHNPFEIVYIGRININHKGLDELVKAIHILQEEGENGFHFSFYGNDNDPDVETFKQMIHGLQPIAQFFGGIHGEEKEKKLKDSDLFILTSRYEGMPMGVLEAISYGLPCLLTPGTNMADDIVKNGAGFKCEFNGQLIAEAILDARRQMHLSAKSFRYNAIKVSKLYSWDKIAVRSVLIFENIINSAKW